MHASAFGGTAGRVVQSFVRPSTLLTLVPVMAATVLLSGAVLAAGWLIGLPAVLGALLAGIATAAITGQIALAARAGDLEAGFLSGGLDLRAVLGFAGRYAVVSLVWGLPAGLLIALLLPALIAESGDGPGWAILAGPTGLILFSMGLVGVVAPTLSMIVATRTDSVPEAIGPEPWHWLLEKRRADLVPFFAALVGGAALFLLMTAPLLFVLALVLAWLVPALGVAAGLLAWVLPAAAWPVLLGRLCGAFVVADEEIAGRLRRRTADAAAVPGSASAAGAPSSLSEAWDALKGALRRRDANGEEAAVALSSAALPSRPTVSAGVRDVLARAESSVEDAIGEAERLLERAAAKPDVVAELAALYQRAGRSEDFHRAAIDAVERALRGGQNAYALQVLTRFESARDEIPWDPALLDRLGWVALRRGHADAAIWCFERIVATAGDSLAAQQGLVGVAEQVASRGDRDRARSLYEAFLAAYPASSLAARVREQMQSLDAPSQGSVGEAAAPEM